MSQERAAIAANRFSFGARPGELQRLRGDPAGALLEQVKGPAKIPAVLSAIPGSVDLLEQFPSRRGMRGASTEEAQRARLKFNFLGRFHFFAEIAARTAHHLDSADGFRERLTRFWSNHFAVSARDNYALPFCASYEREAIRPHISGNFADLLIAAVQHPAMQFYLDNYINIGPNSRAGRFAGRGLNENLGREILELHTLGVDGGYTQDDVVALAKMLTGWSVATGSQARGSGYRFYPNRHEPGDKILLGKVYREQRGDGQGKEALRDLAAHPATAKFIARKLAAHFIADVPPPALVARLAKAFTDSQGDLPTVYRALLEAKEAWEPERRKFRQPEVFMVAALRALSGSGEHWAVPLLARTTKKSLEADPEAAVEAYFRTRQGGMGGDDPDDDEEGEDGSPSARGPMSALRGDPGARLLSIVRQLGQPHFSPPSPAGWPEEAQVWAGPEAVMERVEIAHALSERLVGRLQGVNPADVAPMILGPDVSARTMAELQGAASPSQGFALLLACPEFQYR